VPPKPEAGPARVVVRPPARARPPTLLEKRKSPDLRDGVADIIAREGWATQVAAAAQADPANAPHLTIDAAMLLVQTQLTRAGATRACTRAEVQQAFEYLTNPILAKAVWMDANRDAIVINAEGPL